ncbi:MAG: hypothetical protein U0263_41970 [Polyangiaceae bacterium]
MSQLKTNISWWVAALVALGCSREPPPGPAKLENRRAIAAPAPADVGEGCIDVAAVRACFAPSGPVGVPRPMPAEPTPRGYRCWGSGAERKCEDRGWQSGAFACTGELCTQATPRLPDDGEWECADLEGVVVCHGGRAPAGVTPGAPDVGWICGPRRGVDGEKVCVDFAPDRPEPEPWACRFQYEPGVPRRACRKGGVGPVGRACGKGCPLGSVCSSGHCLPLKPDPSCWLDRDCGGGQKCALGTCVGAAP